MQIHAERGLILQRHLKPENLAALTDPCSHLASQRCGDSMRERLVQAFEVPSARSPETPPVVGVLAVSFGGGLTAQFPREQFLLAGRWPMT